MSSENEQTIGLALKGFSWNVIGNLIRSLAGFIVNIILARLLGPEPFGIIAIALIIISVGNLVIGSGLGSALVQQKEIDRHDISFVFTIQMVFSIFLSLFIIVLAPWLSVQLGNAGAAPVLQWMTIILIFQAFAQVPSALLRRELMFKRLQFAQVTSFIVGYAIVGLPLAYAGLGVWSLVAAQIVQSLINAFIVFISTRHTLAVTFKGSRQLTSFGINNLLANIANWIIQNIDQAIVGRKFGSTNLGFYNRACFLNITPVNIILISAQTSLFSATSKMGKSRDSLRIFLDFMNVFAIFFFSLYCLIGLESANIIQILYGSKWMPTAELLTPLALSIPLLAIVGLEGSILNGLGKPKYEMWAQWATAIFAIAALLFASTISLKVTAWSILIIYFFRFVIMSVMTLKVLTISCFQLLRPILTGLLMGLITFVFWNCANMLLQENLSLWVITLIRCSTALAACIITFWIGHVWILPDVSIVEIIRALAGYSNSNNKMD